MRIIGRIPHPVLQITVFHNDGRFPLQFELNGQTQIYRFRESEQLRSLADVRVLVDEAFLADVLHRFREMRLTQQRVIRTLQPPGGPTDDLPEII